jgi:adenylate cyclase
VRYVDTLAAALILHGVAVAGFGVITLMLYVAVHAGELALFAGCCVAVYVGEALAAGAHMRRTAKPVKAWLAGDRHADATSQAWAAAAGLPLTVLRARFLYAIGALGTVATALVLAAQLDLPAHQAALALPVLLVLFVYSGVLRYIGLELAMRPVLEAIGEEMAEVSLPAAARISLHRRLLATVPMVSWGTGILVGGFLTSNTRDLDTIGVASLVAIGVTAIVSIWLSFVLADAVSAPIMDLRDAARTVGSGDLSVRVPVVSTDETGELAAAFNEMVAGLDERERLREALGEFVDPAVADRVVAEGTDLQGEEVEASILFMDVRGFTAFSEQADAQEVVAHLNALYEAIIPIVLRHGGHANKLIGDALLAVFGAPERHRDHATRAVAAAREIAAAVSEGAAGELRVGVGINSGSVVVGTIGGGGRRDFTVIGDPVNTAALVERATRVTGDDILITETTLRALGADADGFEERPSVPFKGKTATVRLYAPKERGLRHCPDD